MKNGHNISILNMELVKKLEKFGEKINVKNECSDSKKTLKSSLLLSAGKRRLDTGMRLSLAKIDSKSNQESQASNYVTLAEKSPLTQEKPLEQSHKMKQTKDVGNSNAELLSSVAEKKVVDSMEYEDFVAQLTQQNEQQTKLCSLRQETCEISQSTEEKKETMSYSEFLGMFKPPPKVEQPNSLEDKPEAEKTPIPVNETRKEIKYKSVASYFSKTEKKSTEIKSLSPTTMTVAAEIHSPSQAMSENKQTKACKIELPRKTETCSPSSDDEKNEIVFLSSETITEVQANLGKKSLMVKKRINEIVDLPIQVYKKQKVESQREMSSKQNTETLSEMSKKQIVEAPIEKCEKLKDPKSKVFDAVKTNTVCGNRMSGKETILKTSLEHADAEAQTLPLLTVKTSQSTLCFGKSGFSLVKAVEVNKEIPAEEKSCLEAKNEDKATTRRLSSRRRPTNSESTTKRNIHKEGNVEDGPCEGNNENQDKSEQSDQCDPLPGSQLLTPKDLQAETDMSIEIVQPDSVEPCGLRRSARLTRSLNTVRDLDVVEIGSDSEEDVSSSKTKKRGRQGGTPKTFPASGNSSESCSKKTAGKLAPLFTLMKSKQQTGASSTPPEQDRLRKEFLMSGIPDELKRQIATTANASVLLNYPPFPRMSHVQQIQEGSHLSAEVITPKLTFTFSDEYFGSIHSIPLMWGNLGWEHIQTYESLHKDMFQNFTGNSQFLDSQLDLLLKELQSHDDKFPFRRTYTNLHSKVATLDVSSCDVAETKVANSGPNDVVVNIDDEDDDVVVVDDLSASERLVLKHTSEPKASLWSDLHQPDSSEHIIGNTKAIKQLKHWLEEWKVLMDQQERKACRINKNASKKKVKGGWTDDSDFTDSEEEEMTLCNSVLITGPHGVGKTSAVYALAKELGYKVFEVNSSSLRSGKQLLAQLEEATQSHRVAQNKTKSTVFLDTPPAGTLSTKTEEAGAEIKQRPKQKPAASVNLAFANLFRIATPKAEEGNNKPSKPKRGNNLKVLAPENKSRSEESEKKSVKPSNLKLTESAQTKTNRKKATQIKEDIPSTKNKKNNSKEDICGAVIKKQKGTHGQPVLSSGLEMKSQTNSDCSVTSGSLNLTSASLILFDEVDVVFEEDKGFLATVQHFMESTKIPIVLTSTNHSFHLQLHSHHDHISFFRPPLKSAASFLSTVCLAHGVRVDHQSVLNAIRYMGGDVRRCLLYLQFWCESAGGYVQIEKKVDPHSWPASAATINCVDVVKLKKDNHPKKTFGSEIVNTDDSSDCEFISLRPPKKKARQMISDEDDSSHDSTPIVLDNMAESTINKSKDVKVGFSLQKSRSKQKVMFGGKENGIVESFGQRDELPLLHIRLEESLLGIHDSDMSATTVMDFIKAPTITCFELDRAVQAYSVISRALSLDAIYHVVHHCLALPKTDIQMTQLTISAKQKAPTPQISCKKSRKRIVQGDWLDSDSSDEDLDKLTQESTKDNEICHRNSLNHEETVSSKPSLESGLSGNEEFGVESESKKNGSNLMVSVLSEFSRFCDNLSAIDHLETWPASTSHIGNGITLIPGLSDDEKHNKLENACFEDKLHHIGAPVRVLAGRRFCNSIGHHVNSFKRHCCAQTNSDEALSLPESNDSVAPDGTSDLPEEFHLPVQKVLPDFWNIADKVQSQGEPALQNVSKCLSPAVYSSNPSLHLDYMPYLREICRTENKRHLAKTQRSKGDEANVQEDGANEQEDGANEQEDGAKEQEDGANKQEDGAKEQEGGANEQEDGANEQEGRSKRARGTEQKNKRTEQTSKRTEQEDGANEQEERANEQEERANELKDGANELEDGANEQEDGANEQEERANELKGRANEQEDGANEQEDGANEQEDGANEQEDGANEQEAVNQSAICTRFTMPRDWTQNSAFRVTSRLQCRAQLLNSVARRQNLTFRYNYDENALTSFSEE